MKLLLPQVVVAFAVVTVTCGMPVPEGSGGVEFVQILGRPDTPPPPYSLVDESSPLSSPGSSSPIIPPVPRGASQQAMQPPTHWQATPPHQPSILPSNQGQRPPSPNSPVMPSPHGGPTTPVPYALRANQPGLSRPSSPMPSAIVNARPGNGPGVPPPPVLYHTQPPRVRVNPYTTAAPPIPVPRLLPQSSRIQTRGIPPPPVLYSGFKANTLVRESVTPPPVTTRSGPHVGPPPPSPIPRRQLKSNL